MWLLGSLFVAPLVFFSGPDVRYLALGDSFSAGTGAAKDEDFPTRLAALWKKKGHTVAVANVAVNGFTSQLVLSRELRDVESFAPTHVTLLIGANDIAQGAVLETYKANLRRIVERLMQKGVPPDRICLLPQPDWSHSPKGSTVDDPAVLQMKIVAWNLAAEALAKEYETCFIDLFPTMQQQAKEKLWSKDGLHPPAKVYAAWAKEIAERNPWRL